MYNLQPIFDTIVTHLLTQKKKAREGGACVYRTKDNLKCAVGCLIKDEYYNKNFEGDNLHRNSVSEAVEKSLGLPGGAIYNGGDLRLFLMECQNIHDLDNPDSWHIKLMRLAYEYNLTFSPPTSG